MFLTTLHVCATKCTHVLISVFIDTAFPFVTVHKLSLACKTLATLLPFPVILVFPSPGSFLTCRHLLSSKLEEKHHIDCTSPSHCPISLFLLSLFTLFPFSLECAPNRPSFLPLHWNPLKSSDNFAKSHQYCLTSTEPSLLLLVSSSVPQSNPSMAGWELCPFSRVLGIPFWQSSSVNPCVPMCPSQSSFNSDWPCNFYVKSPISIAVRVWFMQHGNFPVFPCFSC